MESPMFYFSSNQFLTAYKMVNIFQPDKDLNNTDLWISFEFDPFPFQQG